MKQTCILILGMHRSGTSALTGVLNMLEVYLGSELLEGSARNEKGYFENDKLYKINEELLSQCDSSWDDIFYDESKLQNIKNIDKLKKTIKKEFEYSNTFAIKDPRLSYLFPIYKKVLDELGIEIKIIIPYRNPIEVANSLSSRDKMSLEKGMLLWAYHFLLTEKFSRGYDRVFMSFDKLMDNTEETIKKISDSLDIDLISKYIKNKNKINEFLEPDLKHHNISIDNLSQNIPTIVRDILKLKDSFNEMEMVDEFDNLRDRIFSSQKLFYNDEIIDALRELVKLRSSSNQVQEDMRLNHSKTKENLAQKDKELHKTKENLAQRDKELHKTKENLNKIIDAKEIEIESLKDELVVFYEESNSTIFKMIEKIKGFIK